MSSVQGHESLSGSEGEVSSQEGEKLVRGGNDEQAGPVPTRRELFPAPRHPAQRLSLRQLSSARP